MIRSGNIFYISDIINRKDIVGGSIAAGIAAMSLSSSADESMSGFRAYQRADMVAAIEKAFESLILDGTAKRAIELYMSPGQELFHSRSSAATINLPIHKGGCICQADFDANKVRPFFDSFPLPSLKPVLVSQLNKHGYQLMNINQDRLENFTIVHLQVGWLQI
jgi:hypothetical protein